MSFFLVGGPFDASLTEVHDDFVAEAREHGDRIGVVVAGPQQHSGGFLTELASIVTSRWPEATIVPIHLDGPGTAPLLTGPDGSDPAPAWPEDPDFALPEGLDQLAGIIVGGGWVPGYVTGLAPAAEQLSRLVRGGAPWLGFSAGAMAASTTSLAGGWRLQGRQVGSRAGSDGFEEVTLIEGLGLVSLTVATHNDAFCGDGLLVSAIEAGLLSSAVAIDEGTCLVVDEGSGRTHVLGTGLVRWFTKDPDGVLVRSERSRHHDPTPTPARPRFAGLAKVAAASRVARERQEAAERRAALEATTGPTATEQTGTEHATAPDDRADPDSASADPAAPTSTDASPAGAVEVEN